MYISLNRLLSHAKAKRIILLTVALLAVAAIGYLNFGKPSRERLIKDLNSQLREGKFEQLYEEADDLVRLNVTKERFVKRMKMAVTRLKTIDENLAFQRDVATEDSLETRNGDGESYSLFAFQKLEKGGKSVSVCFSWTRSGKFLDLWAIPTNGTSEEYRVLGVSAKSYYVGNQVLEW
jgi:hypothetical protein